MEPVASPKPKTSLAGHIAAGIWFVLVALTIANSFSGARYSTPNISSVMAINGEFTQSTTSPERRLAYEFKDTSGKLHYFSCNRFDGGTQLNTCLFYQRGAPAPEFGGIPVEVRYVVADYPPTLLDRLLRHAPLSHEILIAVRNESGVIATNRIWLKSANH